MRFCASLGAVEPPKDAQIPKKDCQRRFVASRGMGLECVVCGERADGLCGPCRAALSSALPECPPGEASLSAVFAYEGTGSDLLRRLKFDRRLAPLGPLVRAAAPTLPEVDAVVPVPVLADRRRSRGYSLPDVLATRVAAAAGASKRSLLRRVDHGAQQGRTRHERLAQLEHRCRRTSAQRVLLVDDVVTTGGTLASCAAALRAAGVHEVHGFVLAATPP